MCIFFFQAEDGIRDIGVTGVQTCALPISRTGTGPTSTVARWDFLRYRSDWSRRDAKRNMSRSPETSSGAGGRCSSGRGRERKSVVEGKSVELGGRRIIKKKKKYLPVVSVI